MKHYYKFISTPYECDLGSSVNNHIEFSITDRDVPLHDMLEQFKYFLQASGYNIYPNVSHSVQDDGQTLKIFVENEKHDSTR